MSAGHVRWPVDRPVWEFDWRLPTTARLIQSGLQFQVEVPDTEGIVFTNVFFNGHKVFFKASLPLIRVHYDQVNLGPFFPRTAGPFKDPLSAYNAYLFGPLGSTPLFDVQVRDGVTRDGIRFIQVQSAHTIGAYRITNRWIFNENGVIQPQLFSAGLRFPANHRHHAYWRFDFDIDGSDHNLAFNKLEWLPLDWGFGVGWHPITSEASHRRPISSRFAILNKNTGRGYQVFPGPNDGEADGFSAEDFFVHRWHPEEDRHGALGSPTDDELLTLQTGESTDGADIVLWYVAHLAHEVGDGGDEWHVCGPILVPFGY